MLRLDVLPNRLRRDLIAHRPHKKATINQQPRSPKFLSQPTSTNHLPRRDTLQNLHSLTGTLPGGAEMKYPQTGYQEASPKNQRGLGVSHNLLQEAGNRALLLIEGLLRSRTLFALMACYFSGLATHHVVMADRQGGYRGSCPSRYRRVAILNGPLRISSTAKRYTEYPEALERHRLKVNRSRRPRSPIMEDRSRGAACFFSGRDRPTAVSDLVVFGALRATKRVEPGGPRRASNGKIR